VEELMQKYSSIVWLAAFCALTKKLNGFFEREAFSQIQVILYQTALKKDLYHLQKTWRELIEADKSREIGFIETLSQHWKQLTYTLQNLEFLGRAKDPFFKKVNHLKNQIASYPPHHLHPLGFYLGQSPGNTWLPFPLMEILSALHQDAQLQKEKSLLQSWCSSIDLLIQTPLL
jgi:hypothetical protein